MSSFVSSLGLDSQAQICVIGILPQGGEEVGEQVLADGVEEGVLDILPL
ncbi:hypothetical protein [Streptomyces europaeiscabiei]|nr:hypothetical protein [Streptomyces europaeiscabiei]